MPALLPEHPSLQTACGLHPQGLLVRVALKVVETKGKRMLFSDYHPREAPGARMEEKYYLAAPRTLNNLYEQSIILLANQRRS